jgi:hypothetical protein
LQLLQHYATHPQGKIVSESGVSFALLRSASALKTTASVGSTARALKCHW